jgi:hypothetical protein
MFSERDLVIVPIEFVNEAHVERLRGFKQSFYPLFGTLWRVSTHSLYLSFFFSALKMISDRASALSLEEGISFNLILLPLNRASFTHSYRRSLDVSYYGKFVFVELWSSLQRFEQSSKGKTVLDLYMHYVRYSTGEQSSCRAFGRASVSLNPLEFVHALSIRISQLDQRNRHALFGFGVPHGPLARWTPAG